MVRKKQMSEEVKGRILALHDEGVSKRQIAIKIHFSEGAVRKFLKRYEETKDVKRKTRKNPVPPRDLRRLKILALANRFASAGELKRELAGTYYGDKSERTIQRALNKLGLLSYRPARKPLLTKKMRKTRLIWATTHINWTFQEWSRVIFSDESRFNLIGPDGSQRVRRRTGERYSDDCVQPTVKHSPSVMVWGCITAYGTGPLIFVDGMMNTDKYKEVLRNYVLPTIEDLTQYTDSPIFQDDSAPCHRSKSVTELKENLGITSLQWPGNSPDLNPIENAWAYLGKRIRKCRPRTMEELKTNLVRIWENEIPNEIITNLYESLPIRVKNVKKSKGGHNKY